MNWLRDALTRVMRRSRKRRMERCAATFSITPATRVLDVGGTPANWQLLDSPPRVTLANMPRARAPLPPGFECVFADGCRLPFADQSFDLVFSNSVIEHVGERVRQASFAAEIRRVGRRYWVQTPNRWFPIEPHLLTPLVHFLPRAMQSALVRRWTVWSALEKPTEDRRAFYIEHYLRDIRLLGPSAFRKLFPGGRLLRERWMGLTKSLVMFNRG